MLIFYMGKKEPELLDVDCITITMNTIANRPYIINTYRTVPNLLHSSATSSLISS